MRQGKAQRIIRLSKDFSRYKILIGGIVEAQDCYTGNEFKTHAYFDLKNRTVRISHEFACYWVSVSLLRDTVKRLGFRLLSEHFHSEK